MAFSRQAALVSSGILLTRLIGFVRQWIFAGIFGLSAVADAFNGAFRIPNMLQTLFGEGVLSASFIPVYAKLLAQKDEEEAGGVGQLDHGKESGQPTKGFGLRPTKP